MDPKSLPACQALRQEARILTAYMSEVEALSSLLLLSSSPSLPLSLSPSILYRYFAISLLRANVSLSPSLLSCSILRTRVVAAERISTPAANKCPPFLPLSTSSLAIPRRSQPFPSLLPLPLSPSPSPSSPLQMPPLPPLYCPLISPRSRPSHPARLAISHRSSCTSLFFVPSGRARHRDSLAKYVSSAREA